MSRPQPQSAWAIGTIAGVLYFSEGLPYGIFDQVLPLYLRSRGVELSAIGYANVIGLAWTVKFFWSPLVDRVGTYARWIYAMLAVMAIAMAGFAATNDPTGSLFWIFLVVFVLASATHDIAADALSIAISPKTLFGLVNSLRVTTYRAALLSTALLGVIASRASWSVAFAVTALVPIVLGLVLFLTLPRHDVRTEESRGSEARSIGRALLEWIKRPRVGILLAVLLLYRVGDNALNPMTKPFWKDQGFTDAQIAKVTTGAGILLFILGAWVGAIVIAKFGIKRSLLTLGLLQMASNVGYAIAASSDNSVQTMLIVAVIENFCGGLGTSAFLSFLMSICDRRFAATEFALLSALFAVSRTLAGMGSGVGAQSMGYAPFFWLTVGLGVPGLLAALFLRESDFEQAAPAP